MKPTGWVLFCLLAGCLALPGRGAARPAVVCGPGVLKPARFWGYHRYRGLIGEQRVTVELTIALVPDITGQYDTTCTGRCRFDGQPATEHYLSSWLTYSPEQPLKLLEADSAHPTKPLALWQTARPAGPLLRGTWTSASGEIRPFELREDYRDAQGRLAAAPYETVGASWVRVDSVLMTSREWVARAEAWRAGGKPIGEPRASYSRDFLHFVGPDTLRPAISQLQCPPPAEHRAQVLAEMQESFLGEPGEYRTSIPLEDSHSIGVTHNDYGLLSWADYRYYYSGGTHGGHTIAYSVYDLNTGEFLSLSDVLRPGAERVLCRLLTRHLQTEQDFPPEALRNLADYPGAMLAPLPESGFAVVETGFEFKYNDYEIGGYADGTNSMTITWAELQPLLLADSPVARMLRERGLWHPATGW